jgi:hypothetical protein
VPPSAQNAKFFGDGFCPAKKHDLDRCRLGCGLPKQVSARILKPVGVGFTGISKQQSG